jgi:hypothetical protein
MVESKAIDDAKEVKDQPQQIDDGDANLKKEFESFMSELK